RRFYRWHRPSHLMRRDARRDAPRCRVWYDGARMVLFMVVVARQREGDGHEDKNMVVLRYGGGRPRRVVGGLAGDPAAGPTSTTRCSPDRQRRHRRGGHQQEWTGSRRLGDRGNDRPGHPIRQERGYG